MSMDFRRTWGVRRRGGGRTSGDEARGSYYGMPVIHKPHWKWMIVIYFFLGGIAGAAYVIATISHVFGGTEGKRVGRVGRYLSFAMLPPSVLMLILDLKRPERFFYMLRVLKLRSPMSVGTWGLTAFGGFCTLSAMVQAAHDGWLRRPSGMARLLKAIPLPLVGVLGTGPAFFVSGYTGVLLVATAVPIWTRNYLTMGPLFLASAMSNATAAIALILSLSRGTKEDTLKRLEKLDAISIVAEFALMSAAKSNLGPTIGKPLNEGKLGMIYRAGVLGSGVAAPLALQALGSKLSGSPARIITAIASVLTLIGGFALRYVLVVAGQESADDPQATFEMMRMGDERAERGGRRAECSGGAGKGVKGVKA
jgi:formate-dependent nitrite reductase membrane component NrfD